MVSPCCNMIFSKADRKMKMALSEHYLRSVLLNVITLSVIYICKIPTVIMTFSTDYLHENSPIYTPNLPF